MSNWLQVVEERGYVWDIGQLAKEDKKALDKQVRQGELIKTRALWPKYFWGTCVKTIWLRKGAALP